MGIDLYDRFLAYFPDYGEIVVEYQKLSDWTLKLICKRGFVLYFTYYDEKKWLFTTEDMSTWLLRK